MAIKKRRNIWNQTTACDSQFVEHVLQQWHPRSTGGLGPHEQYNSLVPSILQMLRAECSAEEIAAFLEALRTGPLHAEPDCAKDKEAANALVTWRKKQM